MATIACSARGAGQSSGNAYWWFMEEGAPIVGLTGARGSGQSAGAVKLSRVRGMAAVGVGLGVGRSEQPSNWYAVGTGCSSGRARLGGDYNLRAAGAGVSSGRASFAPPGSLSVIWIMKIR